MKKKKLVVASLGYVISAFLLKGIGFLTSPIYNRILSEEEMGAFSNISSIISMALCVFSLTLYSSVNNALYDFKEEEINSYIATISLVGMISSFIFGAGVIYGVRASNSLSLFGIDRRFFLILEIYLIFYPIVNILAEKYKSKMEYGKAIAWTVSLPILQTAVTLFLLFTKEDKLSGRVCGTYLVAAIIGVFASLFVFFPRIKFEMRFLRYALPIAIPSAFHILSGTVLNVFDRTMITNICGNTQNAYYSIGALVSTTVLLVWSSINSVIAPWLFSKLSISEYEKTKNVISYLFVFFMLIVVCIALCAPELLFFLGGEKYSVAISVIPPLLVGTVLVSAYTIYVNYEQFYKKQYYIALGTVLAGVINIVLNIIFIPIYGYNAAAYTTMASYFFLFLFHFIISNLIFKREKLFNNRLNWAVLLGASSFIWGTSKLYNYGFIRIIILLVLLFLLFVFCFLKRKMIKTFLKERKKYT